MVKSGIYKITNTVNGKFYIGSSVDVQARFHKHKSGLRRGVHPNPILQRAWNRYGEDKFTFEILEECPEKNQGVCLIREQYYLDLLKPYLEVGYNIVKQATGGDVFTFNPNKEAIREKIRILNLGDKNGMFGKTHSKESIERLKFAAKGRFTLQWFIEKHGESYGTHLYHERRAKLAARKMNYAHDNGLKGKKVKVEATRGKSVSQGRKALKGRMPEFLADISNPNLSNTQLSEKYNISTAAVKYHRKKL
jgi:group I intron endonuclease